MIMTQLVFNKESLHSSPVLYDHCGHTYISKTNAQSAMSLALKWTHQKVFIPQWNGTKQWMTKWSILCQFYAVKKLWLVYYQWNVNFWRSILKYLNKEEVYRVYTPGDSGDAETAADRAKQRGKFDKNEPELSLWILITDPGVKMQPRQEVDDTIIVIE